MSSSSCPTALPPLAVASSGTSSFGGRLLEGLGALACVCIAACGAADELPQPDGGLHDAGASSYDASSGADSSSSGDASIADGAAFDLGLRDAALPLRCPATECDPRATTGCAVGASCRLTGDLPECSGVVGTLGEGEPCSDLDACADGLACFARGASGPGLCGRVCCSDSSTTCAPTERCGDAHRLLGGASTGGWSYCIARRACDVLNPTVLCTMNEEGCYVISASGETDCLRAGELPEGRPCIAPNDCAPEHVCTGVERRTCRRICSLADAGVSRQCPRTTDTCRAYPYSPAGSGVCSPP